MTGAVTSIAGRSGSFEVHELMQSMGRAAVAAAEQLALASTAAKNAALLAAAASIRQRSAAIMDANAEDLRDAESAGLSAACSIASSSIQRASRPWRRAWSRLRRWRIQSAP